MKLALLLTAAIIVAGCVTAQLSTPEAAVRSYFESWNDKDWKGMYNAISDGFKKMEPTASNYMVFENFMKNSVVRGVDILLINVTSNDGTTADVDFIVNYNINENLTKSSSNFVLKYRPRDSVPGWKIIQPYGDKADES